MDTAGEQPEAGRHHQKPFHAQAKGPLGPPLSASALEDELERARGQYRAFALILLQPSDASPQALEALAAATVEHVHEDIRVFRRSDAVALVVPDAQPERATRLAGWLRLFLVIDEKEVDRTVLAGVAAFPRHATTSEGLVHAAEDALSSAGEPGGECVVVAAEPSEPPFGGFRRTQARIPAERSASNRSTSGRRGYAHAESSRRAWRLKRPPAQSAPEEPEPSVLAEGIRREDAEPRPRLEPAEPGWERCEIHPWRDRFAPAFIAFAVKPDGTTYQAGRSSTLRWGAWAGPMPTKSAVAAHDKLLEALVDEGWEYAGRGGEWYNVILRRPSKQDEARVSTRVSRAVGRPWNSGEDTSPRVG